MAIIHALCCNSFLPYTVINISFDYKGALLLIDIILRRK